MDRSHTTGRSNKQTRGQGRARDLPRLLGERLCLHFANTIEGPISNSPADFLPSYAALVRWAWHTGVITEDEADRLRTAAQVRPDETATAFARALALRDAVDGVFRSIARSTTPPAQDLARIQEEYVAALGHARLAEAGSGYELLWDAEPDDLARPLWPVARSAVEVLTGADLSRVKECPGAADCGWLFYDTSRNGRRRWCSMEGCGSRVKMRRHYASRRGAPR
jgi:predicted RNA-binding Zn ribbon-like protein